MEALYYFESDEGLSVLRFFENGLVVKGFVVDVTAKSIPKILTWLNEDHKLTPKGNYTIRGSCINFELSLSKNEVIVCTGTFFGKGDRLNLFSHSHINDFKSEKNYYLYKPSKRITSTPKE